MSSNPLLSIDCGYSQNCKDPVVTPGTGEMLNIYSARALNQSGGAVDTAIAKKLGNTNWKFGTLTAASTPDYTDFTTAIQAGGGVNIFTAVNNGGYLVGANAKFNLIGLNISTAEAGSPVYTYQYYNGSAYTTLTTYSVPATYALATNLVVFPAPQDWVVGTDATVGGDSSLYNIRVLSTTAGSQAVVANAAWVVSFLEFQPSLADKTSLSWTVLSNDNPLILSAGDAILPYFSGSASAKNSLRVLYSVIG